MKYHNISIIIIDNPTVVSAECMKNDFGNNLGSTKNGFIS